MNHNSNHIIVFRGSFIEVLLHFGHFIFVTVICFESEATIKQLSYFLSYPHVPISPEKFFSDDETIKSRWGRNICASTVLILLLFLDPNSELSSRPERLNGEKVFATVFKRQIVGTILNSNNFCVMKSNCTGPKVHLLSARH